MTKLGLLTQSRYCVLISSTQRKYLKQCFGLVGPHVLSYGAAKD
jgi:hypothetical protein